MLIEGTLWPPATTNLIGRFYGLPYRPSARYLVARPRSSIASANRGRHTQVVRLLSHAWQTDLSAAQRALWTGEAMAAGTRREKYDEQLASNWRMFSWVNYTWAWLHDEIYVYTVGGDVDYLIDNADITFPTLTTVTVEIVLNNFMYSDKPGYIAIYQCNPAYKIADTTLRKTRLLCCAEVDPGDPMTALAENVPLAWPVTTGTQTRFLLAYKTYLTLPWLYSVLVTP